MLFDKRQKISGKEHNLRKGLSYGLKIMASGKQKFWFKIHEKNNGGLGGWSTISFGIKT